MAAPFRSKSLVYRQDELKYESDFYNEFFVAPGAMLTEGVSAYLSTAGVFKDVLPANANADGDFVLEGFVSELYGDNRIAGKPAAVVGISVGATGTALAQQHLRNVLAYLDVPTMGAPEIFLQFKDDLFDDRGHIGNEGTKKFLQGWMDKYVAWIKRHSAA